MNCCARCMAYLGLQVLPNMVFYRLRGIFYGHVGRHRCLWCRIAKSDLKETPSITLQLRDLGILTRTHSDFLTKGAGDLKVAKEFFNVIATPFFNLPLDQVSVVCSAAVHVVRKDLLQVCIPGLHISLGIYYRLFKLLEDAVHCLDFEVASSIWCSTTVLSSTSGVCR